MSQREDISHATPQRVHDLVGPLAVGARHVRPRPFRRLVKINRDDMRERGFPRFSAFDKALLPPVPPEQRGNVAEAWPAMLKFERALLCAERKSLR